MAELGQARPPTIPMVFTASSDLAHDAVPARRGQRSGPDRWPPMAAERSVALDVDDLPQRMPDLDQVRGVRHDPIDIFVGTRNLVEERVRAPPLDSLHRRL